jgi:HPt (histidine-containing phosphotransfer) domain-containing protein
MRSRDKAARALQALARRIDDAVEEKGSSTDPNLYDQARHLVIELRATALEFDGVPPRSERVADLIERTRSLEILTADASPSDRQNTF